MHHAITRRHALAALGVLLAAMRAKAQAWPARPIRAVVPFAAGSAVDVVSRAVFEQLSAQLGQTFVVENRAGAGGTIGTGFVAKAEPDGYTLLATSSAHSIAPALNTSLGYDTQRDFVAVVPLGLNPFVLVVAPEKGFKTAREFVTAANARPGAFSFASVGEGSASHLSAERFRLSAGMQAVHIPFKGGPEAMSEVMAGRVDFFFMALGAALPQIRAGKLTALAVNTGRRSPALPSVPTLQEAGFGNAEFPTWFGLFLPAKTPREIVDRLQRETAKALQEPKLRERLAALGVEPMVVVTAAEFDAFVETELALNAALAKAVGLNSK